MTSGEAIGSDTVQPGEAQPGEARPGAAERAAAQRLDGVLAGLTGDARIRFERREQVLWLTIDREQQRNALALSMLDTIANIARAIVASMGADDPLPGVRLLVIRGAGGAHFAAGGDLKELDAVRSPTAAEHMSARGMTALQAVRECPVPVVAALNGAARGGGAELALACDLRVGHSGSAIGFVQATLGLAPAWGGGRDLLQRLGPARGLLNLLEAELKVGFEAVAAGLMDEVLADSADAFAPALERFVVRLAQRPPQVQVALKALARAVADGVSPNALAALERNHLARTWVHPDHWMLVEAAARRRNR
ncbi:MAG: enoyl-CoA hydratase/isomerase family protein [Pseudomonadota bacterium]